MFRLLLLRRHIHVAGEEDIEILGGCSGRPRNVFYEKKKKNVICTNERVNNI